MASDTGSRRATLPRRWWLLPLLLTVSLMALARRRAAGLTVFAHRGFAADFPENTVRAVRGAAGADGIEIDVRRSASGELVCLHDPALEGKSSAPTPVAELDWATLRTREVADGETVARLEDVLEAVPEDVLLNLELKEPGLAADALAVTDHERLLVSSFDPAILREAREAGGEALDLAYVTRSARGVCETAERLDCVAVHPRADLLVRSMIVPRAHRRGLAVNAWTVDSRLETLLLALTGADGVFADSRRCLGRSRR